MRRYARPGHVRAGRASGSASYIRAGDAFQVVLSQRAERTTSASALELYRALRRVNPSPYLFLLELGELALIGSSPETLVKCEDGRASLNPIAGTTHPGDGDAERLLASEKDRAEHVMLVDLGRNDLSRVCRPASVRVARFLEPERFSHVTHLVSEVTGELQDGVTPFDLLRACFPAGTVSGAPKVRAMQIVSELEGYRRGPYAGAVGYVLPGGTMDTCIAIRTIVLARRRRAAAGGRRDRGRLGSGRRAPGVPEQARRARSRDRPRREGRLDAPDDRQLRHFTYNLVHLFQELGAEVRVFRNDAITLDEAEALAPTHLVVSPGPGRPEDAGVSVELIRRLGPHVPTLGVCLGHQAIVEAFGGEIGQAQGAPARQVVAGRARRQGRLRGPARPVRGRPLPLARRAHGPGRARGHRPDARRRGDGRSPPRAPDRGRPVPSRDRC